MAQFGTGSALLGGTDALQEAMRSRGIDTSVLQQQSPASMGGTTVLPTPTKSVTPAGSNAPSNAPQPAQAANVPASETEIILKALTNRLSTLSKNGL